MSTDGLVNVNESKHKCIAASETQVSGCIGIF